MKQLLALLIITSIFLIFLTGFTWLIDIYYPPEEYTHTFISGEFPSKSNLLFAGFRTPRVIFDSLAITLVYGLCILYFLNASLVKSKIWNLILRSLILALFLGSIFFIYKFIYLEFNLPAFSFFWKTIRQNFILLTGLYFIVVVIFLSFIPKLKNLT